MSLTIKKPSLSSPKNPMIIMAALLTLLLITIILLYLMSHGQDSTTSLTITSMDITDMTSENLQTKGTNPQQNDTPTGHTPHKSKAHTNLNTK
uniref:F-ORF n=1 Tax=Echyridella menziesii TaxID=981778 RepID=F4ZFF9_9BIVA|nr:F-ORF [Echyridella menziesii]AEC14042.1 female-specific orf protein [Echyridella menziesii]AQT38528.1 F-ORF [Echyridella menziesii]